MESSLFLRPRQSFVSAPSLPTLPSSLFLPLSYLGAISGCTQRGKGAAHPEVKMEVEHAMERGRGGEGDTRELSDARVRALEAT